MRLELNSFRFFKLRGHYELPRVVPEEMLVEEPMFYSASHDFVMEHGGPITKNILSVLVNHEHYKNRMKEWEGKDFHLVVDSRVTHCMAGFLPSIGGWHCDEVPRHAITGQPDFSAIDISICHFMALVASVENHSCTEFIKEEFYFDTDRGDSEQNLYARMDDYVSHKVSFGELTAREVELGKLYDFSQESVHRAVPVKNAGWRLFFRATVGPRKPIDHIRKQVQVYIPPGVTGW